MIRFADENDIPKIRNLWDKAFGEEKAFNDYFFARIFDPRNTLIMEENSEILTMAQMIPCTIKDVGKATYIYGAVTDPQHRNKGLMRKLLQASFDTDIKNGVSASILIPAEKGLFDFYEKSGYETRFYISRRTHTRDDGYSFGRKATYKDIPFMASVYTGDIQRSEDDWKKQIDMCWDLGGRVFVNDNAYAFIYENVEEIMSRDEDDAGFLLNLICDCLRKKSVEYTTKGTDIPFGMLKAHTTINADKLYMNLLYN